MTTHDRTAASTSETPELTALDQMAARPTTLAMAPRVTYLGGPTYLIEIGRFRIVTDPGSTRRARNAAKAPATSSQRSWAHPFL